MHSPSEEHQLVVCPCKGCSSSHDDIRAYISTHVYEFYKNKNDVVAGVNQVMVMVSTLATKYMNACPHFVFITPVEGKPWFRSGSLNKKYNVVFICASSYELGHEPFEIKLPTEWILKAAPVLKLGLKALQYGVASKYLADAALRLEFWDKMGKMAALLDSLKDPGTHAGVSIPEQDADPSAIHQIEEGDAFDLLAHKANKKKRSHIWKSKMVSVFDKDQRQLIWVKLEYERQYLF